MSQNAREQEQPPELSVLLCAAARGEDAAWRTLMDLYGGRVYALARSRVGRPDVAEEITQSVFVTVASKLAIGEYTEQGRFEPWLFRVTMNRIRDEGRRAKHRAVATDPTLLTQTADGILERRVGGSDSGEDSQRSGRFQQLRAAIAQLPDADREMIELRHHGGLSFKQMAELLGEPLGTLLARHHRALKKLKELMDQERIGGATREVV